MAPLSLPPYAAGQPAARVDACLREALAACEQARQCAVLWFAEVQRRALYRDLGHASLQLYATQALGFSDNRFRQFKRLADDLERLPALRDAVAAGELGWTKAQQVARVAAPATQAVWIARAKVTGRRQLEREVRAACASVRPRHTPEGQLELGCAAMAGGVGSAVTAGVPTVGASAAGVPTAGAPSANGTPGASSHVPASREQDARAPAHVENSRHTITLRVDAWQLARFEALLEQVRRRRLVPAGADRADIMLAALTALTGQAREGQQDQGADETAGSSSATDATHAKDAKDAAASRVTGPAAPGKAPSGAPPAQVVVQRCPECAAATVATCHGDIVLPPSRAGALACDARVRQPGGRNRATVPPRLRASVLARDRHRCASPGCGATHFLEVHHIVPRRAGGPNEAANLVTLCSRCHAFAHELGLQPPHVAAGEAEPPAARAPAHASCGGGDGGGGDGGGNDGGG
jgi:5-methylcytosine-specific restriction endonuclease McrA